MLTTSAVPAILSRTLLLIDTLDLDSVSLTGTDSVSCASHMSWDAACPLRHFASADPESPQNTPPHTHTPGEFQGSLLSRRLDIIFYTLLLLIL